MSKTKHVYDLDQIVTAYRLVGFSWEDFGEFMEALEETERHVKYIQEEEDMDVCDKCGFMKYKEKTGGGEK